MAATQILDRNPKPSREEIRHGLDGNLCRCTGYQHIVEAVEYASKKAAVSRRQSGRQEQTAGGGRVRKSESKYER